MPKSKPTIAPTRIATLLKAAETAAHAIPPAFPLAATVAVNPFLGQSTEDLATASARLERVAGVRVVPDRAALRGRIETRTVRDEDLVAALAASASPHKPAGIAALKDALARPQAAPQALPTVADLARTATGTDWPAVIARCFGLWAAGHFDRGQALWSPAPGRPAFVAWRDWATNDLTPEIAGLKGFCAHVASAPDTPERAILRAADRLGLTEAAAETVFHRLFIDLGGWAQHARWLLWNAELVGESEPTMVDLLAIRLIFEEALMAIHPSIAESWATVVTAHATPMVPTADQVADAIAQEAAERAHQRKLDTLLTGAKPKAGRPALQAAFCIDVRSEVYRRALESLDPAIETIGFAGFFGLPLSHKAHGTDEAQIHLPVLLNAGMFSCSHVSPEEEQANRVLARTRRAWGRFRQAAVSSFAFVEAAGPAYGVKLVRDALGMDAEPVQEQPMPYVVGGLTAEQKAATGAAVLKAMSMTKGHARLVLLFGHGGRMTNNPHESAYHCGACAGQTGEVSSRLLAGLLNDPETRAGLPAHGIELADDTLFVAGLHETTTDTMTLYRDGHVATHAEDLAKAQRWMTAATKLARTERAARLPGATQDTIFQRALNWAEVRPEWGLAGCAAFIAAPRPVTTGVNLEGRAFLHNYDWRADAGFGTLELILTAPVVVASWISLQYYGSAVAPDLFGGGNKLIHNVVGGIGVVEGNGGMLRPGLPWQTIHDGEKLVHDPLRLSVMVEAPREAMAEILARHDGVRALFDNGWLHLFALEGGRIVGRYRPGLVWEAAEDVRQAA